MAVFVELLTDGCSPRISGSSAGVSGGGGDGDFPISLSRTHFPRSTGEVLVPLAVTFKMAAWVMVEKRPVTPQEFRGSQWGQSVKGKSLVRIGSDFRRLTPALTFSV